MDELILEEPEMVKQGSRFGVKLKATAPSIHLIKTNVETEVSPIVGSENNQKSLWIIYFLVLKVIQRKFGNLIYLVKVCMNL